MKLSLKQLVETGGWVNCNINRKGIWREGEFSYRLNFKEFKKLLTDPNRRSPAGEGYDLNEGDFWLLVLEVINMSKKPCVCALHDELLVLDSDDFEYSVVSCDFVNEFLKNRILDLRNVTFQPKIKYKGAIAYYIPKDEVNEYFIKIESGTMQEI